jgi:glycosyltransferase involved in cell wall biosynthesis
MTVTLRILGTRGIPAAHGGFETFAEHLALHLVARGWRVTVYCQEEGSGPVFEDVWQGVQRVRIPVASKNAVGTVLFDWQATRHAARQSKLTPSVCLTLGYNTALFCARLRAAGVPNVINMDGIEWQRAKWGPMARLWLRINELAGAWIGNHLVADHPAIARHLVQIAPAQKITTIPYGADRLADVSDAPVRALGLTPGQYLTLVARAEPENSLLEAVQGFSQRPRGKQLVVLGAYRDDNAYHRAVRAAASAEVQFVGAIYDKPVVQALRFHSLAYIHGHQVGGTNPSLVEALGAGNAVIAHDNRFNRWVVGEGGRFFTSAAEMDTVLTTLLADGPALLALRAAGRLRFEQAFTWSVVLEAYEKLLLEQH